MKTHVSLGMKYPFRMMFLVVLMKMKPVVSATVNTTTVISAIKGNVLPVRNGERDIGSMTENFIDERLCVRHLGFIGKSGQSGYANLVI